MKTLQDGWYVVINAYKFTIFEIWRDFFLYYHLLRVRTIPTHRVYQLLDKNLGVEEWAGSLLQGAY